MIDNVRERGLSVYQIYWDAPLVQEMHFWCTKKVKTFGSGQGKGKFLTNGQDFTKCFQPHIVSMPTEVG